MEVVHVQAQDFQSTRRRTLGGEVPFLAKFLQLPRSTAFFEASKSRKLTRDSSRRIVCTQS